MWVINKIQIHIEDMTRKKLYFLELEMIDVSFLMSCFIDNSMYIYLDKYDYYNEKMKVRAYS